jgi:hypothetical protein
MVYGYCDRMKDINDLRGNILSKSFCICKNNMYFYFEYDISSLISSTVTCFLRPATRK